MPASTVSYPPGHPLRAQLRELLQGLGASGVHVNFESRGGRYHLLSYRTEPARHRLPDGATGDLKAFAMAQIRQGLPQRPNPAQDGKRGDLSWKLQEDRIEARY